MDSDRPLVLWKYEHDRPSSTPLNEPIETKCTTLQTTADASVAYVSCNVIKLNIPFIK